MPGSDIADRFSAIWKFYVSGRKVEARRLFTACLPLLRYELQPALGVSTMKHSLVRRWIFRSATVRHPTVSIDRHSEAERLTPFGMTSKRLPDSDRPIRK
jgi:dihydrodipicolinate synthase/N-acetylneuraminate lyase